ncbi:hypothetical protein [Ferruginibacter profundus]
MPKFLLFFSFLLFCILLNAQTISESSVVIVACKSGTLIIDGTSIGKVEADDATKQTLSYGDHYLQLKTSSEKINQTITIDKNTKGVIKIGCAEEIKSEGQRLINKEVALAGALTNNQDQNVFGFDTDDIININCSILNKKGTATISLIDYKTGKPIYSKADFNSITNERIKIPVKGIYYFSLYTDALFGKTAKLVVDRIPSANSNPNFKTSVKKVYDTTNEEVLKTNTRVFSTTNLTHQNRTAVSINLPRGTTYWAYWIGVGQEAQNQMKNFVATLSGASGLVSFNPLVSYGMKLIPNLPMLNTPATVSYIFMDSKNAQAFISKQAYSYYKFKHADNITTDYSLISGYFTDLVLSLENQNTTIGHDVEIRVVAFKVISKLVMEE